MYRHHPDACVEYKGDLKDDKLYAFLPKAVLDFLGKPMTSESLRLLAEQDSLDLIYADRILPKMEPIQTRSMTRRKEKEKETLLEEQQKTEKEMLDHEIAELAKEGDSHYESDEEIPSSRSAPNRVRFSLCAIFGQDFGIDTLRRFYWRVSRWGIF